MKGMPPAVSEMYEKGIMHGCTESAEAVVLNACSWWWCLQPTDVVHRIIVVDRAVTVPYGRAAHHRDDAG